MKIKLDNIIVVPISICILDHIENHLVGIGCKFDIKNIRKKGMNIERIESLNDSSDFAEALISIFRK